MEKRRVVITGMGAITPLGNSVEETWAGIKAGKSGIGPITYFDSSINKVHYAAEVKNFNAGDYMDSKEARKMARFTQFGVAAAKQCLEDSGLMGNEEVLDESDANLGVFDYDVFPIDVDLDELLSNFVKSDFDVNILKTWDKIKKI